MGNVGLEGPTAGGCPVVTVGGLALTGLSSAHPPASPKASRPGLPILATPPPYNFRHASAVQLDERRSHLFGIVASFHYARWTACHPAPGRRGRGPGADSKARPVPVQPHLDGPELRQFGQRAIAVASRAPMQTDGQGSRAGGPSQRRTGCSVETGIAVVASRSSGTHSGQTRVRGYGRRKTRPQIPRRAILWTAG